MAESKGDLEWRKATVSTSCSPETSCSNGTARYCTNLPCGSFSWGGEVQGTLTQYVGRSESSWHKGWTVVAMEVPHLDSLRESAVFTCQNAQLPVEVPSGFIIIFKLRPDSSQTAPRNDWAQCGYQDWPFLLHVVQLLSCVRIFAPQGLQYTRLHCPSPSPGACSNCVHWVSNAMQPFHPVIPFFSCLQFFPASGSFPMSQLFTSVGQSVRASASWSFCSMRLLSLAIFVPDLPAGPAEIVIAAPWFGILLAQSCFLALYLSQVLPPINFFYC